MKHLYLSLSIFLLFTFPVLSQPGSLDSDFANGGIFTSEIDNTDDEAKAIAIQDDGKIVTAGYIGINDFSDPTGPDFYIRRFNADGSPDMTFGENGIVIQDLAEGTDAAWDVEIQSDGKIVAAGLSRQTGKVDHSN